MPIDSSIALQVKPVQIPDQVNALARVLQLRNAQQEGDMGRMKMDEYQRGVDEKNRMSSILMGGGGADELQRGGFLTQATELRKSNAETAKSKAAADKDTQEVKAKQYGFLGNVLRDVRDQAGYDRARQLADSYGMDLSQVPPAYDPTYVAQIGGAMTTQAQAWADQRAREQQAETGRHHLATEKNAAGQLAVSQGNLNETRRHHGVTEKQQADATRTGKAPAGYRWSADGKALEIIPGGPAEKSENATEGERKAATLLLRMEGSQKQLAAALKTNPGAAKPEILASGLRALDPRAEALANSITGTQRQQVDSAQLDILDAALTLATGAAYTREQLEGHRKSYFPQIGDDADTVKDKTDRLDNVIKAAKIAAGRAAPKGGGASGGWGIQKVN